MVKFSGGDVTGGDFPQLAVNGRMRCSYMMFNCDGGESSGIFQSLNVGLHVGDDTQAVLANRDIIKRRMGASYLLSALQVHGSDIYMQKEPLTGDIEIPNYDALITNQAGVALMTQHADCQAVLLYDSVACVIASVHNGWKGSVQNILGKVIGQMVREYSSEPAHIQAVISPSLGPCCAEFIHHHKELPPEFLQFQVQENYFDFWQISVKQLVDEGLLQGNIALSGQCTVCSEKYFSYRKAVRCTGGVTGRNGSVIVLRDI
jgi:YfiH family protein